MAALDSSTLRRLLLPLLLLNNTQQTQQTQLNRPTTQLGAHIHKLCRRDRDFASWSWHCSGAACCHCHDARASFRREWGSHLGGGGRNWPSAPRTSAATPALARLRPPQQRRKRIQLAGLSLTRSECIALLRPRRLRRVSGLGREREEEREFRQRVEPFKLVVIVVVCVDDDGDDCKWLKALANDNRLVAATS